MFKFAVNGFLTPAHRTPSVSKRGLFGEFCSLEQSSAMVCLAANVDQQLSDMDVAELISSVRNWP